MIVNDKHRNEFFMHLLTSGPARTGTTGVNTMTRTQALKLHKKRIRLHLIRGLQELRPWPHRKASKLIEIVSVTSFDQADLRCTNLVGIRGVNISGALLSKADLSFGVFRNMDLRCTNFSLAVMRSTDLAYADLSHCIFGETTIACANLSHANVSYSSFVNAYAVKINMYKSKAYHSCFSGAYFIQANFNKADLSYSMLNNAVIRKASFFEAKLKNSVLTDSDLRESNLSKADLENAILNRARLDNVKLIRTNFTNASLDEITPNSFYLQLLSKRPYKPRKHNG
jgi:uncharacterized protein YjbI with pentapeptide repeats